MSGCCFGFESSSNSSSGGVSGSGTLNYVPKWTPDGTTLGNSQFYDNGINAGLGTILPTAKFHIQGIDATSLNYALKVDNSASAPILYARNNAVVGIGIAAPTSTLHVVDTQIPDSNRKVFSLTDSIGTENLSVTRVKLTTNVVAQEHFSLGGTFSVGYFYGGSGSMFFKSSLYGANVFEIDTSSHPVFKSPQFGDFYFDGKVGIGMTTPTTITSKLQVVGLLEFADNAAAIVAGLTNGAFYRTGDLLKVVH